MGRLVGLIAIVMGVWLAAEVYTQGIEGAFGGILAGYSEPVTPRGEMHRGRAGEAADDEILVVGAEEPAEPRRRLTPVQGVGAKVQGQIDDSYAQRYEGR